MSSHPKRPREFSQAAKLVIDICQPAPAAAWWLCRNPLASAPLGLVLIKFQDEKA
jgi:hypothetical protein